MSEKTTSVLPLDPETSSARRPSRMRWWICALLFFATTTNYIDRQMFSLLVPYFEDELRIGPMDLAMINVAFLLAYGFGMIPVGRFIDVVGTRKGLAVTFLVWNLASMSHGLVGTIMGFIFVRILLGLGEAGNFPASIKTVAEWFPKRERALATGLFNCGTNIGAVVTPLLVLATVQAWGWRICFIVLGGIGLVWLIFWMKMYYRPEEHPKVSPEELALINSDPPDAVQRVPILTLLSQRPLYAILAARFITDAPWWFYLTWTPKLLVDKFGLRPDQSLWAVAAIYLVADFGAIGGGWISSSMIQRGHTVNRSRKVGLLCAALCTVPISIGGFLPGTQPFGIDPMWIMVALIALAASGHQAWSSNMFTIVSDTLPKSAVAMSVGIGSAVGVTGAAIFQFIIGGSVKWTGGYVVPFVLAGSAYLMGLVLLQLILPRIEPAPITDQTRPRVGWPLVTGVLLAMLSLLLAIQIVMNRPQFLSREDYLSRQAAALNATNPSFGPAAKVGWYDARWVRWTLSDGTYQYELIKFDRAGRPILEKSGADAKKYAGPGAEELQSAVWRAPDAVTENTEAAE